VPLFLVILIQQTLRNGFNLVDFGGFHGKVFLRVDFQFLLIAWVLGTELLAKGSPRGTPSTPKVSLLSVERIGRSITRSFEFFSRAVFFSTVQANWSAGFPNRSDRFSPVGCCEEFLSEKVFVVLWLFLFRGGEVLEAGFLSEGFLGSSGQNRPDRWSDRFPLPVERLSPTEAV
jgi:hypothetical protein